MDAPQTRARVGATDNANVSAGRGSPATTTSTTTTTPTARLKPLRPLAALAGAAQRPAPQTQIDPTHTSVRVAETHVASMSNKPPITNNTSTSSTIAPIATSVTTIIPTSPPTRLQPLPPQPRKLSGTPTNNAITNSTATQVAMPLGVATTTSTTTSSTTTTASTSSPAKPTTVTGSPAQTSTAGTPHKLQPAPSGRRSPIQGDAMRDQVASSVPTASSPKPTTIAATSSSTAPDVKEVPPTIVPATTSGSGDVTTEYAQLATENATLKQKLVAVKQMVAERLQREVNNTAEERRKHDETRAELARVQEQLIELEQRGNDTTTTNVVAADRVAELEDELATVRVELTVAQNDLERLRQHLQEADKEHTLDSTSRQEVLDEYTRRIEALDRERETWETACIRERENAAEKAEHVVELQIEVADLKRQLEDALRDGEEHAEACASLERVLAEHEAVNRQEIENATLEYQLKLRQLQQKLEAQKRTAALQMSELERVMAENARLSALQASIDEKDLIIGKLRQDALQHHRHLMEAMKRLQSSHTDHVDKALITNLLTSFLQLQRGDPKRFEILQIIASVLTLSDDDRVKIGISRPAGASSPLQQQQLLGVVGAARRLSGMLPLGGLGGGGNGGSNGVDDSSHVEHHDSNVDNGGGGGGQSFSDMWINFLLKESVPGESDGTLLTEGDVRTTTAAVPSAVAEAVGEIEMEPVDEDNNDYEVGNKSMVEVIPIGVPVQGGDSYTDSALDGIGDSDLVADPAVVGAIVGAGDDNGWKQEPIGTEHDAVAIATTSPTQTSPNATAVD